MEKEKKDYSQTLNLPKTDFPMRGNLPEKEPGILENVFENGLYEKILKKNENLYRNYTKVNKIENSTHSHLKAGHRALFYGFFKLWFWGG